MSQLPYSFIEDDWVDACLANQGSCLFIRIGIMFSEHQFKEGENLCH